MGQIKLMSESLANQIAAGEVVERPASCIKELIENSLDAGAKRVHITIEEGGVAGIIVQDDGHGMDAEDARLAFSRHATSKLSHERDLLSISTLGFRGEALAAIGAVARVTLDTRTKDAEYGVRVLLEGSSGASEPNPIAMPRGTRIEVRDLFFNTPARLKYLRSVATEQARCVEVIQRAALGRPDVAFQCDVNGHTVLQTTGNGRLLDVIAVLLGVGEARQMIEVRANSPDYEINGYVGRPTQSRASRGYGHWFINGRPIRNLALHQAVTAGFHNRIMVNRHPIYVLSVNMHPSLVDVNIHPHKAEVRFSEERDVTQLIQGAVRKALDEALDVPTVRMSGQNPEQGSALFGNKGHVRDELDEQTTLSVWKPSVSVSNPTVSPSKPSLSAPKPPSEERTFGQPLLRERKYAQSEEVATGTWGKPDGRRLGQYGGQTGKPISNEVIETVLSESEPAPKAPAKWALRAIGQALGMYILADDGENLYIIDQHAVHERVLFEKFTRRFTERTVQAMPLLTPLTLSLSPTQYEAAMSRQAILLGLGLELEPFGGYDVVIRTVPDIWEGLDVTFLAEQVITCLQQSGNASAEEVLRDEIVMRACKAAIKANWYLSKPEMEALCEAFSELEDPFYCPHGRPVIVRLTAKDLEKEFKRIV